VLSRKGNAPSGFEEVDWCVSASAKRTLQKRKIEVRNVSYKLLKTQKKQMINVLDKTDTEIKTDVLSELKYDPSLKVTDIGVLVTDGTVTLNGYATSFEEKLAAVHAVKRVAGVVAIVDDIELHIPDANHRNDGEIAAAAAHKIAWATTIPTGTVQITVRNGWIILEGEVEWWYQKNAAETVMRSITGVHGVSSSISIKSTDKIPAVGMGIEAAFNRNAMLDASKIRVDWMF
jgi:osmotically-inducible protein OsmY